MTGNQSPELGTRVAVLESRYAVLREDIRDLKSEDIAEIKNEVRQLRIDFNKRGEGMTRGEKIALSGVGVTLIMAIVAAIALVQQAPA